MKGTFSAAPGPSLPQPLSPTALPPRRERGETEKANLSQSPSSPGGWWGGWEKRAGVMRAPTARQRSDSEGLEERGRFVRTQAVHDLMC